MNTKKLLELTLNALNNNKALDISVLDVTNLTTISDYMIIASGTSNRQVKALADNVVEKAKDAGRQPMGVEGKESGEWVLVDLADVVVHIMQPATREFYDLERLWQSAESRRAAQQQPTE